MDLITAADLATYIGGTIDDERAAQAVAGASSMVQDYLGGSVVLETDVEIRMDGSGIDSLVLPNPPVRAVSAVAVDGVDLTDADWYLNDHGILFRVVATSAYPGSGPWGWANRAALWPRGRGNVAITYDRGFDLVGGPYEGGDAAALYLPASISSVALALAVRILESGSVPSGGLSQQQAVSLAGLTDDDRETLNPYRDRGALP